MIILDLDNTIADDSWRIPVINWDTDCMFSRYHTYHLLQGFDKVGNTHLFEGHKDIVVFTARPLFYAATTFEWIQRNVGEISGLAMRPDDCQLKSVDLKAAQLKEFLLKTGRKPSDIICAYDDRPDVIDMYKKHGVNAELVSIHNVCAYTKPQGGIH